MAAKKTVALAFSGSGFKFPAHVGALLAVEEAGYEIVELAGTSGGSLVASLFAAGMSSQELKTLSLNRDWSDMMSFDLWSLMFHSGMCSGDNLQSFLLNHTSHKTFGELKIPLTVVASDLTYGRPYLMSKATTPGLKVGLASRASSSIPVIYSPVQIGDSTLVDGGLVNNIPVDRLTSDADIKLGVQLVGQPTSYAKKVSSFTDLAKRTIDLMLTVSENSHISSAVMQGSKMAFVDTGSASALDRNMTRALRETLLESGYNAVKKTLAG